MARHTQLAFAATQMALKNADFNPTARKRGAVLPVHFGVSTSAVDVIEKGFRELEEQGPRRVNSGVVSNGQPQAVAQLIAEKLGRRNARYDDFLGLPFRNRCHRDGGGAYPIGRSGGRDRRWRGCSGDAPNDGEFCFGWLQFVCKCQPASREPAV